MFTHHRHVEEKKETNTPNQLCTKYLSILHFYESKEKEEKHLQRLALNETKEQQ